MGLFSDKDINDAWEIQQRIPGLDEDQKIEFIEGFEKGWKEVKKEKNKSAKLAMIFIRNMPSNPKELPPGARRQGIMLGTFIGFIRFRPLVILTEGRDVYFIGLIKRLKSSRGSGPMYYEQLILPALQDAETQIGIQVATLKLGMQNLQGWRKFMSKL